MEEFLKLAGKDDLSAMVDLIKRFDDAVDEDDRTAAQNISKAAFSLEKKYIPQLSENVSVSTNLSCQSMIMTVGFQKEPIILSILCMKPQTVILLHTDGSQRTAREVEDDPDVKNMNLQILSRLITEYDASENYRVIKDEALPRVSGSAIVVDPTGGRKVMVASLALVAFYRRLPMVYTHGLEYKGIVYPFSERLRLIESPFEFFGDPELNLVEQQFNSHLYEAAYNTCRQLEENALDLATRSKAAMLQELVKVYMDWDSFLHSAYPVRLEPFLSQRLKSVMDNFRRRRLGDWLPDNVDANLEFLKNLDDKWQNKVNILDEFRLVDVYSSALRRETQRKYDDAVARLYRCLEMCSSIKLMEKGIDDTSKPDYDAFCARIGKPLDWLKGEYRKISGGELPDKNIGLDSQMTLLEIIGENIANIHKGMKQRESGVESLMEVRNRSILAHGTRPIPEDLWPKFKRKTEQIIGNTIGYDRFRELLGMATHGDIHIG
jgi:CRISPR-associated protein (TIGR02710 family)